MAAAPPLHPSFVEALLTIAAGEEATTPADAWRLLIPVAEAVGEPRPSYARVRRFLVRERPRILAARRRREQFRERLIRDLLAGRAPQWLFD